MKKRKNVPSRGAARSGRKDAKGKEPEEEEEKKTNEEELEKKKSKEEEWKMRLETSKVLRILMRKRERMADEFWL